MSSSNLHSSALRISILHILRATGYHSTRPSVLDALVTITERFFLLISSRVVFHALSNHASQNPTITDIRLALTDVGTFSHSSNSGIQSHTETWTERLRRPIDAFETDLPFGQVRGEREEMYRDESDIEDVKSFIDWITGDKNREMRRIAGMLGEERSTSAVAGGRGAAKIGSGGDNVVNKGDGGQGNTSVEDFLTILSKKGKAIVDEQRWMGTVLGADAEDVELLIEGGNISSISSWCRAQTGEVPQKETIDEDSDSQMVTVAG